MMKRPSNLIIAFILVITSTFLAYAAGRIFLRVFSTPGIELEQDYDSRLNLSPNTYQSNSI